MYFSGLSRGPPTFPHGKNVSNLSVAGLDVPPPVGAGGVTAAKSGQGLARVDVQPSRRAVGAGGEATTGKELLDGNGRYGQIF